MAYGYITIRNGEKYRIKGMRVFFNDLSSLNIIEKVIDEEGKILNFPGIEEDERIETARKIGKIFDVRFEAVFTLLENGETLMYWTVQPDGMYWMDNDGFGITNDKRITLYSTIDENGNFLHKFRLYSIGNEVFADEFKN